MGQDLEIRKARPEELQACADLYLKVLTETFTWLPPERHDREDFIRSARTEEIYVALEGERIVAVAGFYRPMNFIHSLYVAHRGRGVGRAMLEHLQRVATGPLSLKVQAANLKAQAFYARQGFVATERGRDFGSDIEWIRLVRQRPAP